MQLPDIESIDLEDKRVLVRGDLDADPSSKRFEVLIETINKIFEKGARQVVMLGHRGRPEGKRVEELSNKAFIEYFSSKLNQEVDFVEDVLEYRESGHKIVLLENLRFFGGEESGDEEFAKKLALWGDVFVNEAFGVSHRAHASIVLLPKLLPSAAGVQFVLEVNHLAKILVDPHKPVVFVISGLKEDKAKYVDKFAEIADTVLVGGRLPSFFGDDYANRKVQIARLLPDKEDITMRYIEQFEEEVRRAKTVVVSGPLGKFEDPGHRQGTERVFRAVAESDCYSVAGGGDTEAALEMFGLKDKIDWISTGGGAMLEFLASGTLPGMEALLQ